MALEKFRLSSRARLNFTERKTLPDSAIALSAPPDTLPLQVRINGLALADSIPDDAQIFVEAYRSSTGHFERLKFGDAKPFKDGTGFGSARPFLRIKNVEGLRFRLKIVTDSGRLIAEADGLRAIEERDERSVHDLFPVIPKSLNGELWRVEFPADGPELWVEKSLDQEGVFLWTLPAFQALVLPAALRLVAERIVRRRDRFEPWFERWRTFLSAFHPSYQELSDVDTGDDEDEPDDEVVDAVLTELSAAFARKFELMRIGISALREGGAE